MHPEVVGDNCDLRRDLVRAHSRPYPLCERSATLCDGPMRFDHPGLFSTSDLTSAERLALNELEETLALPSLEVGDYPQLRDVAFFFMFPASPLDLRTPWVM